MSDISQAVDAAITELEKGISLLEQVFTDDHYKNLCSESFLSQDTLGKHWRHILNFYQAFMKGYTSDGVVDYSARENDPELEQNRDQGIALAKQVVEGLQVIKEVGREKPLSIKGEYAQGISSVNRELDAIASHTNHHIASMKVISGYHGLHTPGKAGWSPSTLEKQLHTDTVY